MLAIQVCDSGGGALELHNMTQSPCNTRPTITATFKVPAPPNKLKRQFVATTAVASSRPFHPLPRATGSRSRVGCHWTKPVKVTPSLCRGFSEEKPHDPSKATEV